MPDFSPRPAVTQKQIAEELGVSRQLVSSVLNGSGRISEENRQRVRETARRLGYFAHSNQEARAMIARRYSKRVQTGLLGCVYLASDSASTSASSTPLPYETHLLHGIRQVALNHNRDLLLLHSAPSSGWERVDGLLVHSYGAQIVRDRLGVEIPIVSMMSQLPGMSGVMAEDRAGVREATEYLIGIGHRRIGYLISIEDSPAMQERLLGYQEALRAASIEPRKSWVGQLINWGLMLERGHHSMQVWLKKGWERLGCTALLVQNDRAAIGAMMALREAGFKVPQDVSVIGFDSTDECELTTPRLTSVQVPLEQIGAKAAGMLIDQIESEHAVQPYSAVLPTRLQIRDSTAPPQAKISRKEV